MVKPIQIGNRLVSDDQPCFIVAEIGINHNGDVQQAIRLIDVAVDAGCNAVKFQKRTVSAVYSQEELNKPRESVFGTTNGDLKYGLELDEYDYDLIDSHCQQKGILWFASPWDTGSVEFLEHFFDLPCYKVASACLTDDMLLKEIKKTRKPIILSTGMSTYDQIHHAVQILDGSELILLHTTSTYPSNYDELNLMCIRTLKEDFHLPIGYSGHETGIATSVCAAALGACVVERHITTDRSLWGSDQAASLEPNGITRLVRDIRLWEQAKGDGIKRVYEREIPIIKKLRKVGA